jgi:hypothetical protein
MDASARPLAWRASREYKEATATNQGKGGRLFSYSFEFEGRGSEMQVLDREVVEEVSAEVQKEEVRELTLAEMAGVGGGGGFDNGLT